MLNKNPINTQHPQYQHPKYAPALGDFFSGYKYCLFIKVKIFLEGYKKLAKSPMEFVLTK